MSAPARENGKACRVCSLQFGFFSRRHHCRACGCSVCDTHSQTRREVAGHLAARVCDSCVQARTLLNGAAPEGPSETQGVIYATGAVCPRCMLESRDASWKPASVIEEAGHVWLVIRCGQHPEFKVHYSSDPALFRKGLEITALAPWAQFWDPCVGPQGTAPEPPQIAEWLARDSLMLPAVVEMTLFAGGKFVDDSTIRAHSSAAAAKYKAAQKQFVFKANGKLASDIPALNRKLHLLTEELPPSCVLIVELTHERMTELCLLEDSVLLESRVFPCLSVFMEQGAEADACGQVRACLEELQAINGISVGVSLIIDQPHASLSEMLELLRASEELVRLVRVTVQRSPRGLVQAVHADKSVQVDGEYGAQPCAGGSVDLSSVLRKIEADTAGSLQADDWAPASVAQLLEPLALVLGFGSFLFRPSPLDGFVTCTFQGAPVSRVVQLQRLFTVLSPLLAQTSTPGWKEARTASAAVQQCVQPGQTVPDVLEVLKSISVPNVLKKMQFFVADSEVDFASADALRRVSAAVQRANTEPEPPFVLTSFPYV